MTEYGYRGPAMDYGLHSPSGKMSKQARAAAMKRETAQLFAGVELNPPVPQPSKRERLLYWAAELRKLADNGFRPKYHRKHADRLEAEAMEMES